MKKRYLLILSFIVIHPLLRAQSSDTWTLKRCVEYAAAHNTTIQQSVLNDRLAKLSQQQAVLSQIPNLNVSGAYGYSYGHTVDPTNGNSLIDQNYSFLSLIGNADVLLFGWFQRRNNIARTQLESKAADEDLKQAKDDIALNVVAGYMRALLAKEQITAGRSEIELSRAQLGSSRKLSKAGVAPDLGVALLEAQLSSDSASLIGAEAIYDAALLDLKALLDLDLGTPFDLSEPDVDAITKVNNLMASPEMLYAEALSHSGAYRSANYKAAAAQKAYSASRGALLPQLALVAQVGSVYTDISRSYTATGYDNTVIPSTYINIEGAQYPVYQNTPTYSAEKIPLADQLKNNLTQTVALSLNVPIFNGFRANTRMRQSHINAMAQDIAKHRAAVSLQRDVYNAYDQAKKALKKYEAAQRSAEAAERASGFVQKRYAIGLATPLEYLQVQNGQYSFINQRLAAKYDLYLKLKVIDYYMGKDLGL